MSKPVALLSVRPRFAEALLNGSKTVEIRRRQAHIADGAICLLYASSPVRALVGAISVEATDTDLPEALWSRWGTQTGLQRDEYDDYLKDSGKACAIVVSDAVSFPLPVKLSELRRRHRSFVTPQSYRFLGASELTSLLNGEVAHLKRLAPARKFAPDSKASP
jgi:predicted transcriptional regulator